jgi:hypothetical protein
MVEATHSLLSVGSFAELDERKAARLTSFAVRRQIDVGERADGGEVLTQLCLGRVIGKVANKKAHSHQVPPQFGWYIDTTNARRVAV